MIPGPTVDDLASALAALDGFESSPPADVAIRGYQGKRLRLTVPDDLDPAEPGHIGRPPVRYRTDGVGTVPEFPSLECRSG